MSMRPRSRALASVIVDLEQWLANVSLAPPGALEDRG
jgi:hypothetical protein